jgi:2-furoyl-CoA dehydrogenase 2Fe-2S iron sulfur subunit
MRVLKQNERHRVCFTLNGEPVEGLAEPRMLLTDFIRHEIGATGTHVGCEHGICGACTIRIDGKAVRACLMLAVQADGRSLRTVEGLSENGELHPLQRAFNEAHALQCGFCTPGFLMSMEAYLREHPDAQDDELREALAGNLCRCTGYLGIIEAVEHAARELRGADVEGD